MRPQQQKMAVAPEEFTLAIEAEMADEEAHVEAHVEAQEDVRPKRGRPAKRRRGELEETGQDPAVWDNMTLRSGSKLNQVPVTTQNQSSEESEGEDENLVPCSQNRRRSEDAEPRTPTREKQPLPVRRLQMVDTEEEDMAEESDDTVELEEGSQQTQKEARQVKKARRMILQKCNEILDAEPKPSPSPSTETQVLVDVITKLATGKGKEEKSGHHPFYESMSLQTYDGSEDFQDYLTQFKAIASLKSWSQQQKATILLGRLKGSALSVAATLCDPTYDQLVEHLKSHFGPRHAESYAIQLSAREQQKGESLSEFAHAIRKLTRGAYPDLDVRAQDRLARERFVAGISDSHVRTRLRDLRPQTMPKALEEARILSENKEAEKQRTRRVGWMSGETRPEQPPAPLQPEMTAPAVQATQWTAPQPPQVASSQVTAPSTDLVAPLQELVRHLQLQQPNQQAPYRKPGRPNYRGQQQQRRRAPATSTTQCWQCQQFGHYSKDCPTKQVASRGGPQHSQMIQTAPPPPPRHSQPQMSSQQTSQGVPPLIPVPPASQQQMSFPVMSQPVPSLPPHQPVMYQPQPQQSNMEFGSMYGMTSGIAQREASHGVPQPGNGSGQQ